MRYCLFALLMVASAGCYNDKETVLYPETACTPSAMPSYATEIVPILQLKCNNCHSGSFASGNILLDSYAEVKKYADNGKLLGTITWAPGYSPMPVNGNKLPGCQVATIQAWIVAGAPNN